MSKCSIISAPHDLSNLTKETTNLLASYTEFCG